MRCFLKKVGIGIALFVGTLIFLVVPMSFLIPYEEDDYLQAFFVKEKMLTEHTVPTIFLLGGSNVAFGYDSKQIEDSFQRPVVNLGLHAGFGMRFIMDHTMHHLREGDILLLSPEYRSFFFQGGNSGGEALVELFYLTKGRILEYLDIDQIKVIVKGTIPCVAKKIGKYVIHYIKYKPAGGPYALSGFNSYGDVVKHRGMLSVPYPHKRPSKKPLDENFLNYFCQTIGELRQRGVTVFLFPPVLARTSYEDIL
ncbi:MAG: hypothetical protein LBU03_03765 [Tannerellaceae bacterium]|jgi:hypothetical protein|nr:hypothetical protein [Tannerellaceae bacterium]